MRFASTGSLAVSRPPPCAEAAASAEPRQASPGNGFSLLETLTALTILAIALTGLFQAHAMATRSTGTADNYATARLIGEARLAELATAWNGGRSASKGTHGNFAWSFEATPHEAPWAAIKSKENWRLYRLRVRVAWAGGRDLDLETLKIGRESAPR
jgi:general secretion pathway protein I